MPSGFPGRYLVSCAGKPEGIPYMAFCLSLGHPRPHALEKPEGIPCRALTAWPFYYRILSGGDCLSCSSSQESEAIHFVQLS
jgi:hypothetical protein